MNLLAVKTPGCPTPLGIKLPVWTLLAAFVGAVATFADEPIAMNTPDFTIPIQMSAAKAATIKQLKLYVSVDKGATWDMMKTAKPTQKQFSFKSAEDGEYWFILSYVDQSGKQEPAEADVKTETPGLKILIDTKKPIVELRALPRDGAKAVVSWKIREDKPDLETIRLEVKSDQETSWRPIAVSKSLSGQADWPAQPQESFTVRLSIKDLAKNEGTAEVPVTAARSFTESFSNKEPEPRASEPARSPVTPPPPSFSSAPPTVAPVANAPRPVDWDHLGGAKGIDPDRPLASKTQPIPKAMDRVREAAVPTFDRSKPALPADGPAYDSVYKASTTSFKPVELTGRVPEVEPSQRAPAAAAVASTNTSAAWNTIRQAQAPAATANRSAVATKYIPVSRSNRLQINYELRGVGQAGVGKIELYYTNDKGQTWKNYGEDPDREPPFDVTLPGEGLYGFRIVVTNRAGVGQKPPVKGDAPKMQVEIDSTPPKAELYEPAQDPSAVDSLLLSWGSEDNRPADNPVSLYFAEQPRGPWYEIKTDLPATGKFSWRVPRDAPYQVYLRLVAKDLAENVSVADTSQPVLIDFSRPEGDPIDVVAVPVDGKIVK